jgi:hypothetical protein
MNRLFEAEVFVRVVEDGSLTAAARRLGMTTSHVSKLVTRLEERLGAQAYAGFGSTKMGGWSQAEKLWSASELPPPQPATRARRTEEGRRRCMRPR